MQSGTNGGKNRPEERENDRQKERESGRNGERESKRHGETRESEGDKTAQPKVDKTDDSALEMVRKFQQQLDEIKVTARETKRRKSRRLQRQDPELPTHPPPPPAPQSRPQQQPRQRRSRRTRRRSATLTDSQIPDSQVLQVHTYSRIKKKFPKTFTVQPVEVKNISKNVHCSTAAAAAAVEW